MTDISSPLRTSPRWCNAAIVERWGAEVIDAIDAVSHELDTDSLRQLNTLDAATPGVDDVAEIAAAWLQAKGLA